MGKKPATKTKVKVGPPKRSKKKSTTQKAKPSPQQAQPPPTTDSATATVQRIFGNAQNKFLTQRQDRPEATAPSIGASTSTFPNANSDPPADPLVSPPSLNGDADEGGSTRDDSASESADLSDVDGNSVSQAGSASDSESESDADDAMEQSAVPPLALEPKLVGKGKEKEGSGQASKGKVKKTQGTKPARFGLVVFIPIVPVILPGNKLPTLPLPTPHDVRGLREAKLCVAPPSGQLTFSINGNATNDEVDRFFRKILPKPFKAMGKDAKYHLMYGHGSTIGGCGTDSPTGFDIMTAYRAGKSNALKVLYLVPAKPISDEKIKSWSVDAVVAAIRDRLQTKKRKRSVSSDSNSEDGTEESDWASESGDGEGAATDAEEDAATDAGEDAATDADEDAPVTDSVDAGLAEQDFEPEVIQAAPPRKKRKIGSGQSAARKPKKASCTTAADAPEPTGPSSRILRERNRLPTSSNTISKAIDPLNPWHNPSSYVL